MDSSILHSPFEMIKSCLILLGLIAAASAMPIQEPIPEIVSDALMFNASVGAYNPAAAVSYAKANCASGPGLCAEFASRAMAAGGAGNPIITWVPTLQSVRHIVFTSAIILHLPYSAVVGQQRLEKHRVRLLRPRRLHRDLRHDVPWHGSRSLLHGRRPHFPAQPLPLQVPVVPPSLHPFVLLFASTEDPTSHAFASCSTSGAWGTRRVYCKGC